MMRNIEISIKVDIKETETNVLPDESVEKVDDGFFRLVLDGKSEMNIDELEAGLLQTNYPALRDALSHHLEKTSKKKRI